MKCAKVIGLSAAGLVAVLMLLNLLLVHFTGDALRSRISTIRAAGDPVTLTDLKRPGLPAEKNAAIPLRRVLPEIKIMLGELKPVEDSPAYQGGKPSAKDVETLRKVFDAHPQVMPLLLQAAQCPEYDPEHDYSAGTLALQTMLMTESTDRRGVFSVLAFRGRLLLAQKQTEEALRSCLVGFRIANHLEKEPLLIPYLVTVNCRGVMIGLTNETLRAGPVSDALRRELDAVLARSEGSEGFRHAVKTERAFALDSFDDLGGWFARAHRSDDACQLLDYLKVILDKLEVSYAESEEALTQAKSSASPMRHPLANLSLPAYSKVRVAMERTRALVRCLRVLNAIQLHKLNEVALNNPLDEHALGLPASAVTDPLSAKSLLLKKTPTGLIIYSVGTNLVDDGGDIASLKDFGIGPLETKSGGGAN